MVHTGGNSRSVNESAHGWSVLSTRFQQLFNMSDVSEENKRAIFLALCGDIYDENISNGANVIASDLHRERRGRHRHPKQRHHRHRGHDFHRFCELHGRFRNFTTDRH